METKKLDILNQEFPPSIQEGQMLNRTKRILLQQAQDEWRRKPWIMENGHVWCSLSSWVILAKLLNLSVSQLSCLQNGSNSQWLLLRVIVQF